VKVPEFPEFVWLILCAVWAVGFFAVAPGFILSHNHAYLGFGLAALVVYPILFGFSWHFYRIRRHERIQGGPRKPAPWN
jgi:hypothetical protein